MRDLTPSLSAAVPESRGERFAALSVMAALRGRDDLHAVMREVIDLVRRYTGIEAVGIRLADGDDFPYFETSGFDAHFVELERYLCRKDLEGRVRRGPDGKPVLECMCGNLLRGNVSCDRPYMTGSGAFVTNCTTELGATFRPEDVPAHPRNRCTGAGFESIALFPLRSGGRTFGLLQLNDHRRDLFSAEDVALLERLADIVAFSLAERHAERQLRRSLVEKEALLREVHHRVKNNLQTITSLVRLRARAQAEPGARSFAESVQSLIAAMALVHDQLYAQSDVSLVDLGAFTSRLARAAGDASGVPADALVLSLEHGSTLPADRAIPFGLMVHELVANSLRHAFPAGRRGRTTVRLMRVEPDGTTLTVGDDGVGLPETVEFPGASSGGLSLVEVFAAQLGAVVSVERSSGTCFRVHLPAAAMALP